MIRLLKLAAAAAAIFISAVIVTPTQAAGPTAAPAAAATMILPELTDISAQCRCIRLCRPGNIGVNPDGRRVPITNIGNCVSACRTKYAGCRR